MYRAVMLASQANAPVCVTKVMSRSSADVIADSRRAGEMVVMIYLCMLSHCDE